MGVIQRIKKPTTRKGKKVLLSREPKPIEGPKQSIFLQARNPSERARKVLKDLYDLKKPDAAYLSRKNDFVPFEDATLIEKLCYKKDASLFGVSSHSKKRPHNIILGRTFNYGILDMIELGAENFKAMSDFHNMKVLAGIKPCLLFNGPVWELNQDLKRLKSLFTDFFYREKYVEILFCVNAPCPQPRELRCYVLCIDVTLDHSCFNPEHKTANSHCFEVESVRLQGLEHVISFSATDDGTIYLRSYRIHLKKSGQRTPRIELEEIGPSVDFKLRRTKLASADLFKEACRIPKELKPIAKKNQSTDAFGTKLGRIHMGKQDINRLQTRKMKGLKKSTEEKKQMLLKKKMAKKEAKKGNMLNA